MPVHPRARAAVFELSQLLNTGLDRRTVQICMALVDAGVNPHALAAVIKSLTGRADDAAAGGATAGGDGTLPTLRR